MSMLKNFLLSSILFSLALGFLSFGSLAQVPDVTIIPEVISVNSSFLVKVEPNTMEKPLRITWSVYNTGDYGIGSFPIVDGKGICYFSNTDENSTCGPSPFRITGPTELYVNVITPTKIMNRTRALNISNIVIPLDSVNREGDTLFMYFYIGQKDQFTYSMYKEDLTIFQTQRGLTYSGTRGRYEGNITLSPGVYYFSFVLKDGSNYGSNLMRVNVPSEDFVTLGTDKGTYYIGEEVKISGRTNANSVTGFVNFPNGTKSFDFSVNVFPNNSFYHSFVLPVGFPDGTYDVKTTSPLEKSKTFLAYKLLEITPPSISGNVSKGGNFTKTIQIKNNWENSTGLNVSTTGDVLTSHVFLAKTLLGSQETAGLSLNITNIQKTMAGTIKLTTDLGVVLEIPVNVKTETVCPPCLECPPCPAGKGQDLSIEPDIWAQYCTTGEEIYKSFTLINTGNTTLSSFSYEVGDAFGSENSLEDLDYGGDININPLTDLSIGPSDSKYVDVTIKPYLEGTYQGKIKLKSSGNEATILISLNCFPDVMSEINSTREIMSALNLPEDLKTDIETDLSSAESAFELGSYLEANNKLQKAKAKIEAFKLGSLTPAGFDLTTIVIIVVVIIIAVALIWFFKLRKPGKPPEEEEFEEF